jgi:hypothetical protein
MGSLKTTFTVRRRFRPLTCYAEFIDIVLRHGATQAKWPAVIKALAERSCHLPDDFDLYLVPFPVANSLESLIMFLLDPGDGECHVSQALYGLQWGGSYQDAPIGWLMPPPGNFVILMVLNWRFPMPWECCRVYIQQCCSWSAFRRMFPSSNVLATSEECARWSLQKIRDYTRAAFGAHIGEVLRAILSEPALNALVMAPDFQDDAQIAHAIMELDLFSLYRDICLLPSAATIPGYME